MYYLKYLGPSASHVRILRLSYFYPYPGEGRSSPNPACSFSIRLYVPSRTEP